MRQSQAARAQQSSTPQLIQSMMDAWRVPDLRAKILFTMAMLVIFRFVAQVPVPGVDTQALSQAFDQQALLGFLDLFSGGALANLSVAALGVYPYITASIVMQILTPAIPSLKAISQEGEYGRQRINQITHWLTVPIAFLQSWGQLTLLRQSGVLPGVEFGLNLPTAAMLTSMVAGTLFLVWLGELITERGLGNGISLIIFGGIVARFPSVVGQGLLESGQTGSLLLLGVLGFGIIYVIVMFTEAQRRVPVQYGRSVFRGGRMQRQSGSTFLPLRVNSAGMIPLIFAFSIIILPATIASYFRDPLSDSFFSRFARFLTDTLDPSNFPYWAAVFFLVVIFTFFYTLVIFQQQNLAESLQRNGGFIPGIRPGRPTQEYLNRVIIRITWGGALFLGIIAIIPFFVTQATDVRSLTLSSTSLLIMVGVALDTMRQLESQLLMRNYEGFIH
ncbi:MAG: preprotein translocase subunit SecY [SAR202 cluster bacterium]|mgnify:FL=1|jgi:preprotein translocase subunit SecY|nr:preprotein translocase subunit SecY [Chloroflexota bacterium]MDP6420711.1 preprotein translocase subunit SecY [SAR202 cluster bacterium]HAL48621.1 preprotein translocase subunit SecY [Dehalococcoidia bacterium]MDP6663772.1 preprotein translocase subunit SecY [SAR202 cluster bacterium]MDP6798583.1 preprotein translocase subunit SecY [SAR202 cluster bacterium]|tara:strand:- start:11326 stop:12663 length:1338 start_codon:yes stop_codon:yes gene_type:complete